MKKKLEAELISIAHRILKLKNRAELDQLREETLKLYEKLSVLKFVEDNFSDIKPTIGYASAEGKLEEIYDGALTPEGETEQETPEVKANEEEAKADSAREEKKEAPVAAKEETEVAETEAPAETKEAEPETKEEPIAEITEEPKAEEQTEAPVEKEEEGEEAPVAEEEPQKVEAEAPVAAEEEAAHEVAKTEEKQEEPAKEVQPAKIIVDAEVGLHPEEEVALNPEPELPATGTLPETEGQDKDNTAGEGVEKPGGKPAVSEEEKKNTEASGAFNFTFERKEDAPKQKEISFEDFQDYKEPEFVKKSGDAPAEPKAGLDDWRNWEPKKEEPGTVAQPKAEEPIFDPLSDWRNWEPSKSETKEAPKAEPVDDWRNWEPSKPAAPEAPKEEAKPVDDWRNWEPAQQKTEAPKSEITNFKTPPTPEPVKAEPAKPAASGIVRAMSLGLNDRIAFEKNLFGGSSEDLNRVVSQLNTLNTFQEAKDFIDDLVKPDYNNWNGKEEFEERFMQLVEKKFS